MAAKKAKGQPKPIIKRGDKSIKPIVAAAPEDLDLAALQKLVYALAKQHGLIE